MRVYAAGLKGLPIKAVQLAASSIVTASKWFPSVAELRTATLEFIDENDRRKMQEFDDRRTAEMLRTSWQCCDECWRHPCRCDKLIETPAETPQLEGAK